MAGPLDSRSAVLIGIGAGFSFGLLLFADALPSSGARALLTSLSFVGFAIMGIGLIWGVYSAAAFQRTSKPDMPLESGEYVVKWFPGGHRDSKYSGSIGKWFITNKRLIFEGKRPRTLGFDPEVLAFSLEDFVDIRTVDLGKLDKYLEASFRLKDGEIKKVEILCRKRTEFTAILQLEAGFQRKV